MDIDEKASIKTKKGKERIDEELEKDSSAFLVKFLYCLSNRIWKCAPINLIKECIPSKNHNLFTEIWVIVVFILSILFYFLINPIVKLNFLSIFIVIIIVIRILLILNSGVRIPLHFEVKGENVESAERSLILFSMNFFEIVFWFGGLYKLFFERLCTEKTIQSLVSLHYSFVTATGIGNQDFPIRNQMINNLSLFESVVGFMMIVFIFVRFISTLSCN